MTIGNAISLIKLAIPIGLLLGLLWFRHDAQRWHLAFDKLKAEYIADSQMAVWRQQAANQATEARYSTLAEETHADYQTRLARAYSRSDGFMRANRACAPGGTAAAAESAGAAVPTDTPADAFVAVSTADVRACTDAAVYAMAAHQWAASLGE